ncbi:hypothetical protein S83_004274 [Arachis hypogaea]
MAVSLWRARLASSLLSNLTNSLRRFSSGNPFFPIISTKSQPCLSMMLVIQ